MKKLKIKWLVSTLIKNGIKSQIVDLKDLKTNKNPPLTKDLISKMKAFGYTTETLEFMLLPLVTELRDPLGSMGNDAALACLSDKPRMIYDYFKQLFAQITNHSDRFNQRRSHYVIRMSNRS